MTNARGFLLDSPLGGMPPLPGLPFPGCTGCLAWRNRGDSCFKGFPENDLMLLKGFNGVSESDLVLLKCYDSISENVLMLS